PPGRVGCGNERPTHQQCVTRPFLTCGRRRILTPGAPAAVSGSSPPAPPSPRGEKEPAARRSAEPRGRHLRRHPETRSAVGRRPVTGGPSRARGTVTTTGPAPPGLLPESAPARPP